MTDGRIPPWSLWNLPVVSTPNNSQPESNWGFLDDLLRATSERPSSHLWTKWRDEVLAVEPWCRRCPGQATEVDHIVPLADGGTNRRENLQPLCHECHSWKTMWENIWRSASNRAGKSAEQSG